MVGGGGGGGSLLFCVGHTSHTMECVRFMGGGAWWKLATLSRQFFTDLGLTTKLYHMINTH